VPQIALGLLGLLPDLGGDSTSEQREKVRISSAYQNYAKTAIVTRVRLDYPPHRALIEARGPPERAPLLLAHSGTFRGSPGRRGHAGRALRLLIARRDDAQPRVFGWFEQTPKNNSPLGLTASTR
jgi:hypothetical protein